MLEAIPCVFEQYTWLPLLSRILKLEGPELNEPLVTFSGEKEAFLISPKNSWPTYLPVNLSRV